jgi:hypothetical protein
VPLSKNWVSESNSGFQDFKKGVSKAILRCLFSFEKIHLKQEKVKIISVTLCP